MTVLKPKWFKELFLPPDATIRDGIKIINEKGHQFLLIVDDQKRLIGVVSDGDIRRSIAAGIGFETQLHEIMTCEPIVCTDPVNKKKALELMKTKHIRYIPVVGHDNQIIDVLTWQDFLIDEPKELETRPEPVVIMAGGKGTRLDPFTKILPKPLIPFGDKPMIEWIMDNFASLGFMEFWITLNYKKNTIKNYFSGLTKNYDIGFIEEERPLGTAGALKLLEEYLQETFLVTNCDVVLEEDFRAIVDEHKERNRLITIVAVPKHIQIPYGVLEVKDGILIDIREKPELSYLISAGVYVLEPSVLEYIKTNEAIEMPDLIKRIKSHHKEKVGIYPASSKWFDIGQWEDYQEALLKITKIKL